MKPHVLVNTKDLNHKEWLEYRKRGVGGSDAAAIAGLNPYSSPITVYYDKISAVSDEKKETEAMYFGNVLEDVVAREFMRRTEKKVRNRNAILQHPEHDYMLANVDRLVVGENAGLECKTTSEYMKNEWIEGEHVPDQYFMQCQHYMAVTGADKWYIAVLIGGNKFMWDVIERDEDIVNYLIDMEGQFWQQVIDREPPAMDGSEASDNVLKMLYPPDSASDVSVELPLEVDEWLVQLEEAKKACKTAEKRKKELENKIKGQLGTNEKGRATDHFVSWAKIESYRLDSKRLKKERPDIYEQYAKKSSYRKFNVTKRKTQTERAVS